jgi:hypothetical protein
MTRPDPDATAPFDEAGPADEPPHPRSGQDTGGALGTAVAGVTTPTLPVADGPPAGGNGPGEDSLLAPDVQGD